LLDKVRGLITGDRNASYGPPNADFDRTAGCLNALGFRLAGKPLKGHHIAIIIAAVKLSRLMWSPEKEDNWVDLAGYAACGHECVILEGGAGTEEVVTTHGVWPDNVKHTHEERKIA